MNRTLARCLSFRPNITSSVLRGTVRTFGTTRTTHQTQRLIHHGSILRSSALPNGLTSYDDHSPDRSRVFVIRKSSTNNDTGRKHSHHFRTVLPLHNGVLGVRGASSTGVCGGARVRTLVATLKLNVGNRRFSVSRLHCRHVYLVASTSMSNTRVHALLLAFFCHCRHRLISRNCICVTYPPLCGMRQNHGR